MSSIGRHGSVMAVGAGHGSLVGGSLVGAGTGVYFTHAPAAHSAQAVSARRRDRGWLDGVMARIAPVALAMRSTCPGGTSVMERFVWSGIALPSGG
jgi:hypothetical protein